MATRQGNGLLCACTAVLGEVDQEDLPEGLLGWLVLSEGLLKLLPEGPLTEPPQGELVRYGVPRQLHTGRRTSIGTPSTVRRWPKSPLASPPLYGSMTGGQFVPRPLLELPADVLVYCPSCGRANRLQAGRALT